MLAIIRRTNGDVFRYSLVTKNDDCIKSVEGIDDFKKHCIEIKKVVESIDFVHEFPTLGSRFRDNKILLDKINFFFSSIENSSSIDEVTILFISTLN